MCSAYNPNFNLFSANGSKIATYGTIKLLLEFDLGRTFDWVFVIADAMDPILGADFLSHYGIQAGDFSIDLLYTDYSEDLLFTRLKLQNKPKNNFQKSCVRQYFEPSELISRVIVPNAPEETLEKRKELPSKGKEKNNRNIREKPLRGPAINLPLLRASRRWIGYGVA
ncbi:hypothetical protein GWI33_019770 [Rhynchophorus ferrugineus]|uniref:Uncharacterized protein n=1 Tax=Rhynchophorus ferrugineus TaxID=354439 RepID=A0A834HTR2_RHYFE|nr:hypothetical protein GWI33_019770 [Rhynchophorus ferrugineus]